MRTHFENNSRIRSQRLAELQDKTTDLERRLSDARNSLEQELAGFASGHDQEPELALLPSALIPPAPVPSDQELSYWAPGDTGGAAQPADDLAVSAAPGPGLASGADGDQGDGADYGPGDRTETLVSQGRRSAYRRGSEHGRKVALAVLIVAALIAALIVKLSAAGPSWPASVAIVQGEVTRACQNPDVKSEPGQVNFACAKATRQVLWVFALLTSGNNPDFADPKTGRLGLEPITPAQGGEVAWSLNLHHPYDPTAPVDSLQVAARAINNIIGGATVTRADGNTLVQAGLESSPANCRRYTGSAALIARDGFPSLCARAVTSPAGQAALVADVYQKWVVGASHSAARAATVLFENADNPGDAQVQAILRNLSGLRPLA